MALGFLLVCSCFPPRPEIVVDYDHMLNSTAALVQFSLTDQTYHIICAGTFISEFEVLTAAHCVSDDDSISPGAQQSFETVEFIEVITYEEYNAESAATHVFMVSSVDHELDLAILTAVGSMSSANFEIASIAEIDHPRIGTEVYSVGHPMEIGWNVSAGIISNQASIIGRGQFIHTNASSFFGSSGGPLFNSRGEVIGVCHAIFMRQNWLVLFVGPRSIQEILNSRIQVEGE